ncbi:unnamed protein product, partial [Musa textilis]
EESRPTELRGGKSCAQSRRSCCSSSPPSSPFILIFTYSSPPHNQDSFEYLLFERGTDLHRIESGRALRPATANKVPSFG